MHHDDEALRSRLIAHAGGGAALTAPQSRLIDTLLRLHADIDAMQKRSLMTEQEQSHHRALQRQYSSLYRLLGRVTPLDRLMERSPTGLIGQ